MRRFNSPPSLETSIWNICRDCGFATMTLTSLCSRTVSMLKDTECGCNHLQFALSQECRNDLNNDGGLALSHVELHDRVCVVRWASHLFRNLFLHFANQETAFSFEQ